ncbi:hypothetical protein DL96DRAFT_1739055 [Flagelloscypha sp. PMI_526]|nr:hypothetical protein DL96DRAFT_1739055 [Flagelloscypha sp. PMI_526]
MAESLHVGTAKDEVHLTFLVHTFVKVDKFHRMDVFDDGPLPISDEHQIFTWKVPIFVFWYLPKALPFVLKELSQSIWEVASVDIPHVLKHFTPEFGKLCPSISLVVKYLSLWIWQASSNDIPRILRHLSSWIWQALSVNTPRFITSLALVSWYLTKMVGLKLGHATQAFVFAIHTAIRAIISFFRSATLKTSGMAL